MKFIKDLQRRPSLLERQLIPPKRREKVGNVVREGEAEIENKTIALEKEILDTVNKKIGA